MGPRSTDALPRDSKSEWTEGVHHGAAGPDALRKRPNVATVRTRLTMHIHSPRPTLAPTHVSPQPAGIQEPAEFGQPSGVEPVGRTGSGQRGSMSSVRKKVSGEASAGETPEDSAGAHGPASESEGANADLPPLPRWTPRSTGTKIPSIDTVFLFEDESAVSVDAAGECLTRLEDRVSGFLGAAVVNRASGVAVRAASDKLDMDLVASGNADFLRAKIELLEQLVLDADIEDILISLTHWFCIIRPLNASLFLYVVLDRTEGNLAMARREVTNAVASLMLDSGESNEGAV